MHILPLKILCSQICIVFLFSFSIINYFMYFLEGLAYGVRRNVFVVIVT